MLNKITSYDIPQWLKDKLNGMQTVEEVREYQSTVKAPNECAAGDPDLLTWWACEATARSNQEH